MHKLSFVIISLFLNTNIWSQNNLSVQVKINQVIPCFGLLANGNLIHSLKMFPIPANGKITLEHVEKIKQIQLFDLTGKLILTKVINANNYSLDLSSVNNGVYILVLTTENEIVQQKIIVNHE